MAMLERDGMYIWSDGVTLHLDGVSECESVAGVRVNESAILIPQELFDELVVIRMAQLVEENRLQGIAERVVSTNINLGAEALRRMLGRTPILVAAFENALRKLS